MAKFLIPNNDAQNPNEGAGNNEPFPEGVWQGVIETVRIVSVNAGVKEGPEFVLSGGNGTYVGNEAEVLSFQLGSNEGVLDDAPTVGERKMFDDLLVLRVDNSRWDEPDDDEPSWRLDQTRRRLTNLALAVGAVEVDGDMVGPIETFDALLRETAEGGGLLNVPVRFEVVHEEFKRRDGTKGKKALVKSYFPAV